METTEWVKETGKSIDLLCSMRELTTLYSIKTSLEDKIEKCSVLNINEIQYCETSARILTLNEVIQELNEKILELTKK